MVTAECRHYTALVYTVKIKRKALFNVKVVAMISLFACYYGYS